MYRKGEGKKEEREREKIMEWRRHGRNSSSVYRHVKKKNTGLHGNGDRLLIDCNEQLCPIMKKGG